MSISIWILIFNTFLGLDWHGDHSHDYSITEMVNIKRPIVEVRNFYADMISFGESHPLIEQVSCLSSSSYCYQYKINEKPFNGILYRIQYFVEVENPVYLGEIRYIITEIPFISPLIVYRFERLSEAETRVHILVKVEGSVLFRKFLAKKIMKAQFDTIDTKFSNQGR